MEFFSFCMVCRRGKVLGELRVVPVQNPLSERVILPLTAEVMGGYPGNGKVMACCIALLRRSKRMKAFIETAIIVLKAIIVVLELIRAFL